MDIEHNAMLCALVLLVAVVVLKIVTARLVISMEQNISGVQQEKKKKSRELGGVQLQKNVAEQNKASLLQKKLKLEKKKTRLCAEIDEMEKGKVKRKQQQAHLLGEI